MFTPNFLTVLSNLCMKLSPQGETELKPDKSRRIYSMGRKRFLQILESNLSDSGCYTCEIGDLSTSCDLNIYGME